VRRQFLRYVVGRAAAALLLVFLVSSAALLLAQAAPGDYASQFGVAPERIEAERHRLGLDRPLLEQYARWLRRSVTFDLGESFQYQRPVTTLVRERAANTALLAVAALLIATLLGIPGGILTGSQRGMTVSLIRGLSLVLISLPPLITSLVLLMLAARTGWLPVGGMGTPEDDASWVTRAAITLRHLVIPAAALGLPLAATIERLQSQSMGEAIRRTSTLAARARGIPAVRVVGRHAWRLSLGPLLAIYGVLFGSLLSGSFAVELATSWPGLGDLMRQALVARDTYLVAGCAAAGAVFLAAAVLVADVVHGALDPRVDTGPHS
jgi:peptide/nickel transport system permease protein